MKLRHTISIRRGINLARVLSLGLVLLAVEIHSCRLQASPAADVWVVASSPIPAPIRNALMDLREAVVSKGRQLHIVKRIPKAGGDVVVIGLAGSDQMGSETLRGIAGQQPSTPESFLIRRLKLGGRQAIVAIGADERGLMYAIYELAERVQWAGPLDPVFKHVADIFEEPFIRERAVSIYTMSKPYFESRLYDENHWRKYFQMLARNRFNTFVLIFGYEASGYFAPPYPWFFDVEGFPEVRIPDMTPEQQERNRKALQRMIDLAHEYGLHFRVAIWDHIFRRRDWDKTQGFVRGLSAENLVPYTRAALPKFFQVFRDIDSVQFRMHWESGLLPEEMGTFWPEVYRTFKKIAPNMLFEARAKDYPDALIDEALRVGLKFRLATKYWAEQMGLPFHPTHVPRGNQYDRRHGYGDFLKYPKRFPVFWRLWNGGTTRILLWGDPEYARRFAESTKLYDGDGYEVNEPLATKMADHHDIPVFELLNPKYRYYEYEFERYWHFFQVFGRVGYNPETPAEVWRESFVSRFGPEAGPLLMEALHTASKILPRIIGYAMPEFPTTRGWVEKERCFDLPRYAELTPSDLQQFLSFEEAARFQLQGRDSAKIWPQQTSRWFQKTADVVLDLVQRAGAAFSGRNDKEFRSTVTDLKILGHLAEYHANRSHAGVHYAAYKLTGDLNELDQAIEWERKAIQAWERIVDAAGDMYAPNLIFGLEMAGLTGHWRDELNQLHEGLKKLEEERNSAKPKAEKQVAVFDIASDQEAAKKFNRRRHYGLFKVTLPQGNYRVQMIVKADNGKTIGPMRLEVNGRDYTDYFSVKPGEKVERMVESRVAADEILAVVARPSIAEPYELSRVEITRVDPFIAHMPVRRIRPGEPVTLKATIAGEAPIRLARVVYGRPGGTLKQRDLLENGPFRYSVTLPAGEIADGDGYYLEAADQQGRYWRFPEKPGELIRVRVSGDRTPPEVSHQPIRRAPAGQDIVIRARVRDESGVAWVRIRYRNVNQYQDFQLMEMVPKGVDGEYEAVIPASHINLTWDFMYLIEAMDRVGNGKIYPDLEKETPYVIVHLERGQAVSAGSGL